MQRRAWKRLVRLVIARADLEFEQAHRTVAAAALAAQLKTT
jgi:hypothetical protein